MKKRDGEVFFFSFVVVTLGTKSTSVLFGFQMSEVPLFDPEVEVISRGLRVTNAYGRFDSQFHVLESRHRFKDRNPNGIWKSIVHKLNSECPFDVVILERRRSTCNLYFGYKYVSETRAK